MHQFVKRIKKYLINTPCIIAMELALGRMVTAKSIVA